MMLNFNLTNNAFNPDETRKQFIAELENSDPIADNPEYIKILNKYPLFFQSGKENLIIICNMIAFDLEYETQKYLSNHTTNPKKRCIRCKDEKLF